MSAASEVGMKLRCVPERSGPRLSTGGAPQPPDLDSTPTSPHMRSRFQLHAITTPTPATRYLLILAKRIDRRCNAAGGNAHLRHAGGTVDRYPKTKQCVQPLRLHRATRRRGGSIRSPRPTAPLGRQASEGRSLADVRADRGRRWAKWGQERQGSQMNRALDVFVANAAGAQWPVSATDRTAALHANMWHAYADAAELTSGSSILVTGGHGRIRVRSGDRLTIEMPDGQRYEMLVLQRGGHSMTVADQNGAVQDLSLAVRNEHFENFKLSEGFSREIWSVE
jgi:hypothetical protein